MARWGGEEFVILLKLTDLESAQKMAEKLRCSLESLEVPVVGKVTASFGVSSGLAKGNLFSLLERADKALYESKNAGRNRVTCA